MARSIIGRHPFWGVYANAAALPNTAGGPNVGSQLLGGDMAYANTEGQTYTCTDPTAGAAVWVSGGGGGGALSSYVQTGDYNYVQAATPVEDVVGQFSIDPGVLPGATYKLRCIVTPTFGSAGWCRVRVYDLGPVAGPPSAPVEITANAPSVYNLEASASGLQFIETAALSTHATTPSAGTIVDAGRMYEVTVEQDSASGDQVYVGFAGLIAEV